MKEIFHMATEENKALCDKMIKDNGKNILPIAEFMGKMQKGDEGFCKKCYDTFKKERW